MDAQFYQDYSRGIRNHGARMSRGLVAGDVMATLAEQQRRNEARYQELLHELEQRLGYETVMLWLDTLPEMGGNEMIATLEARIAELDAEAQEVIEAASPCPHTSTHAESEYGEPGELHVCDECGEVVA